MLKHVLNGVAAIVLVGVHSASADVVFTNYPKDVGLSYTISATPGPFEQAIAQRFTPTANYVFDFAKVGLINSTTLNGYTITLYDDSGGNGTPGDVLDTISNVQGVPSVPGTGDVIVNSVSHPILTAGDNYFLAIFSDSTNTRGGWTEVSSISDTSNSTDGGLAWSAPTPSAGASLEIDGTLVLPEPASAGLITAGSVGFLALRRRVGIWPRAHRGVTA